MRTGARPAPFPGAVGVARPAWLTATALACAIVVIRVALVVFSPYERAVGLFDDDAFYYFGVAEHVAAGHGSTFNGLDPTNGYHPLWLVLLIPVFAVADGHLALVVVTLVSSVLLLVSARLIDRIGLLTGRPVVVTGCAAPLLVLGAAGPSFYFSGMETGLLLTSLLWLAVLYLRSGGFRAEWFGAAHACAAGAVMALAVLSRLDSVIPMTVLGLVAAVGWWRARRPWFELVACLAAIPAVALAAYVAVNIELFRTALPVSGQAKALGGGGLNLDVVGQFVTSPVLFGQSTWLGAIAVAVVVAALAARPTGAVGDAARFGAVVLAGGLCTIAYYAVTSSWQLWPWYFSPAPLAIALAAPALITRWAPNPPARKAVAITVCLLVVATIGANAVRAAGGVSRSAFIEAGPAVAARIDAVEPLGMPIAMGDRAGSLGYHLDRPLVHLEGLVNSPRYLEALRNRTVGAFLAERGVGLYARGDADPGRPDPTRPGCAAFTEPQQGAGIKVDVVVCDADLVLTYPLDDGTSYRVWRIRPSSVH